MKLKKKEDQNVDVSVLLRRENKAGEKIQGQIEEQGLKKRSTEIASPGELPHMQPPNPSTIADPKKYLLAGTRYGCLLRGSPRVIQIQRRMLAAKHQTEHEDPKERARERTERAERFATS